MKENLTKIDLKEKIDFVKDKNKTFAYGVDVYDFRNKVYALLTHCKSSSETVEELVNGVSSGNKNFISLSSISFRNQSMYYNGKSLIFGYDDIPIDNFICSSITNMGSNYQIKRNSSDFDTNGKTERGLYELSDPIVQTNSEILCLRHGLRPKYIVVPDFREPNSLELDIAKKYGLKIALTQDKLTMIKEPVFIPDNKEKIQVFKRGNLDNYRSINILNHYDEKTKIGILTDIHGLIEPAITILESMRLSGVDQIYSLGDNIGTGSNPSEVIDLLNEYNVKSIKGNHESYLLDGIEKYEQHLRKLGAFESELNDLNWTKEQLRLDQIEDLKKYKDYIELNLANEKILLTHYLKDYNDDSLIYDTNDYDLILQGHKHFYNNQDKIITMRASGMGYTNYKDVGNSYHIILTEKKDGIDISETRIKYPYNNTISSLIISNNKSKEKMIKWVKGK